MISYVLQIPPTYKDEWKLDSCERPGNNRRKACLLDLKGKNCNNLCSDIIKLDASVIFASVGSFTGVEIAYAQSPSIVTLVADEPQLSDDYCAIVTAALISLRKVAELIGEATNIVTNFEKNLRIIIIPIFQQRLFLFLITTRESDPKMLTFQISKLIKRFEVS